MDKESNKKDAISIRQEKEKQLILEQLRRLPVIQVACERSGISRATFYRFRAESQEFRALADEAIEEGMAFITDLSEAQLISMVRDKNFQAVQFWLRKHNRRYADKVEISGQIEHKEKRELSPEEKMLVEKSLRLVFPAAKASEDVKPQSTENNNEKP